MGQISLPIASIAIIDDSIRTNAAKIPRQKIRRTFERVYWSLLKLGFDHRALGRKVHCA
jgi:hypothetical protein